jgi:lysophospholipase L1-like esterase
MTGAWGRRPRHANACVAQRVQGRALTFLLLVLVAAAPLASTPLNRSDLPWWRERFAEKQAELRRGPVDLVFYGDSITQNWERTGPEPWRDFQPIWQHFYGGRHAINLGFKGDTTAHLLWRIENGEASFIHPKAAVILIGANNFGRLRWPAAPTETAIEKIVAELHARLPSTHLLLLGVLPSVRSPWVDQNTIALNRALAARYRDGHDAVFMDLSAIFMNNGRVDPQKFMDVHLTPPDPPLHPDAATQARMAAAIEPILSGWLGDKPRAP